LDSDSYVEFYKRLFIFRLNNEINKGKILSIYIYDSVCKVYDSFEDED
jgi:hypothetical protein